MKNLTIVSIVAVMLLPVFAWADTIEMSYVGVDAGGKQNLDPNGEGGTYNGANGVMAMNTQNPTGPLAQQLADHVWVYCYQSGTHTAYNYAVHNVDPLSVTMGTEKAAMISQLWGLYYDDSWQADTYIYYSSFVSGQPVDTVENREALAFSFAVYEIGYDFDGSLTSLDLDSGTLQAVGADPSAAIEIAKDWMSSLVLPNDYTGPVAELLSLTHSSQQDLIVEVPEPGTMCLLGLGALALIRKRRK